MAKSSEIIGPGICGCDKKELLQFDVVVVVSVAAGSFVQIGGLSTRIFRMDRVLKGKLELNVQSSPGIQDEFALIALVQSLLLDVCVR